MNRSLVFFTNRKCLLEPVEELYETQERFPVHNSETDIVGFTVVSFAFSGLSLLLRANRPQLCFAVSYAEFSG